ncbi:MAG: hypothetical protein V3W20_05625 [Candidatus Neomarinimicrobiota bacterium]
MYPDDIVLLRDVTAYTGGPIVEANKNLAADQNNMGEVLEAVENTLGLNPEGGETDVVTRLEAIETAILARLQLAGGIMSGDLDMDGNTIDGFTLLNGSTAQIVLSIGLSIFGGGTGGGNLGIQVQAGGKVTMPNRVIIGSDEDTNSFFVRRQDLNGEPYSELYNDSTGNNASIADYLALDSWNTYGGIVLIGANNTVTYPDIANAIMFIGGGDVVLQSDSGMIKIMSGGFADANVIAEFTNAGQVNIKKGDVEIEDNTKGIILNSATKKWRVTIDDSGVLQTTDIT